MTPSSGAKAFLLKVRLSLADEVKYLELCLLHLNDGQ